jgi:hypothetical protein
MLSLKKIKSFFFQKYRLYLDESCLNQLDFKKYRLKIYGGQGYVFADYDQILNEPNLSCDIVPHDLIKISVHHYERKELEKKSHICEIFPTKGMYKISLNGEIKVCSAKELINNKILLNSLSNAEIALIAHQDGYDSCRQDILDESTKINAMKKNVIYFNQR